MALLEGLVILAIIMAGVYVGYNVWQESIESDLEAHSAYPSVPYVRPSII